MGSINANKLVIFNDENTLSSLYTYTSSSSSSSSTNTNTYGINNNNSNNYYYYLAAICVSVPNPISYTHGFVQEQHKACADGGILRCVPVFASLTLLVWSCCLIRCGHTFCFAFVCSCVNIIEFYYHRGGGYLSLYFFTEVFIYTSTLLLLIAALLCNLRSSSYRRIL
jgi:hypothetical protein